MIILFCCTELREFTAQKIKFATKDFFSKYDQIHRKLWIWSHLLKKSLMENLNFDYASARNKVVNLEQSSRHPKKKMFNSF